MGIYSGQGSNLLFLNYPNIAFYYPQLSFQLHLPRSLRYIVRQLRAITRTVHIFTSIASLNRSNDFWQISVKCAFIMVTSVAIDISFRNESSQKKNQHFIIE